MATYTGTDKAIAFLFDIAASIAADYDSASTYAADAYVIYSGTLYKCISAISTPEEFTPAHWQAVLIMDEVAAGGGGGGGGTTVIANPAGSATETLNKLQVGSTIYDVPSGGGGGSVDFTTSWTPICQWTDGRSVYQKTYIFTASDIHGNFDSNRIAASFYLENLGYDLLWIDFGNSWLMNMDYNGGSVVKTHPLNYTTANGSMYTRCDVQRDASVNSGNPYIYFENTFQASQFYSGRNNLKWFITLRLVYPAT